LIYHKCDGVKRDYNKAIEWYTLAARAGHANAMYNLATMYDQGQGVEKNYVTAFALWKLAAEQEHQLAAMNIASLSKVLSQLQLQQIEEEIKLWQAK
jgi:hypothetical protein